MSNGVCDPSNSHYDYVRCNFCNEATMPSEVTSVDDGESISLMCKQCEYDMRGSSLEETKKSTEKVCEKVKGLVYGTRAAQYGAFAENADRVLQIYRAITGSNIVDTPECVCIFMVAFKLAREGTKHKRDNLIDAAGYIELWDQILETPKKDLPF